jgi:hypothetical protein
MQAMPPSVTCCRRRASRMQQPRAATTTTGTSFLSLPCAVAVLRGLHVVEIIMVQCFVRL